MRYLMLDVKVYIQIVQIVKRRGKAIIILKFTEYVEETLKR